jgi:hypothetical protein
MIEDFKLDKFYPLFSYLVSKGFNYSNLSGNYHFEKGNESLTIQNIGEYDHVAIADLRSQGDLKKSGFLEDIKKFKLEESLKN